MVGKQQLVVVLLLCFLCCDPVLSRKIPQATDSEAKAEENLLTSLFSKSASKRKDNKPDSNVCENLLASYAPIIHNFIGRFAPHVENENLTSKLRKFLEDKSPGDGAKGKEKRSQYCKEKLLARLRCTAHEGVDNDPKCKTAAYLTYTDLIHAVWVTMNLQSQDGWLVHDLRENIVDPLVDGDALSDQLSETRFYETQRNSKNTLVKLLNNKDLMRDVVSGSLTVGGVVSLTGVHRDQIEKLFDKVGIEGKMTLGELIERIQEGKVLPEENENKVLQAVSLLTGFKLNDLEELIKHELKFSVSDGEAFSDEAINALAKCLKRANLSETDITHLTSLSRDQVQLLFKHLDVDQDGSVSWSELLNWLEDKTNYNNNNNNNNNDDNDDENNLEEEEFPNENEIKKIVRERIDQAETVVLEKLEKVTEELASQVEDHVTEVPTKKQNRKAKREAKKKNIVEEAISGAKSSAIGSLLKTFNQSFLGKFFRHMSKEQNTVVAVAKIIVWCSIYGFSLFIIFYLVFNRNSSSDYKQTIENVLAPVELLSKKEEEHSLLGRVQTQIGAATTFLQNMTVTKTTVYTRGLSDPWLVALWIVFMAYFLGAAGRYILWKYFGHGFITLTGNVRATSLDSLSWYQRDDFWSLLPIALLAVPMVQYTVRFINSKEAGTAQLSAVYLELLVIVSTFQFLLLFLEKANGFEVGLVEQYVNTHKKETFKSENKKLTTAEVLALVFEKWMQRYDDTKHCQFDDLTNEFMLEDGNKEATIALVEFWTLVDLCQSKVRSAQRRNLLLELGVFELVLFKVSLSLQKDSSSATYTVSNTTSG